MAAFEVSTEASPRAGIVVPATGGLRRALGQFASAVEATAPTLASKLESDTGVRVAVGVLAEVSGDRLISKTPENCTDFGVNSG